MALRLIGYPSLIRRMQAPVIMKMLRPTKTDLILDAGCDLGQFTYEIARQSECVGIDWGLRENWVLATRNSSSIQYLTADVQRMPFGNSSFDKILLSSVLQMVRDDTQLLAECRRVLKETGTIVISVPTEYTYFKKLNKLKQKLNKEFGVFGKGYYSEHSLVSLLKKCRFEVEDVEKSPKRIGSFLFEFFLYFCEKTGLSVSSLLSFFLFPLGYFDRFDRNRLTGNEIIVKGKLMPENS